MKKYTENCQFFALLRQNTIQYDTIFCVKSVKIYTGQKKFTRAPPVAPVTNMRYDGAQWALGVRIRPRCSLYTMPILPGNKCIAKILK